MSRRGPRCPEGRLSQHYIGSKMTFCPFSNFCRKSFPRLTKEISFAYWMNLKVLPHDFWNLQLLKLYKNVHQLFLSSQETFFSRNLKKEGIFLGRCNVETASLPDLKGLPCSKVQGFEGVFIPKKFQRLYFFFWVTQLVAMFLSYLPVKQIWRKSAVSEMNKPSYYLLMACSDLKRKKGGL